MKKILETILDILMMPVYLVAGVLELLRECWWLVLIIAAVLLWPRLLDRPDDPAVEEAPQQVMQTEFVADPTRVIYNTGVCKSLAEDAHVIVLFVNDNGTAWEEKEMASYLQEAVDPAMAYLREQAEDYGVRLALDYSYYVNEAGAPVSISYSGTILDSDAQEKNPDLMEQCAQRLGYESQWAMLETDRADTGLEQIAYLVCVNGPGRSYAVCSMGASGMEYPVLFNDIPRKWERRNGVVHELLHVFGAEDMYAEGTRNQNREKLAKQLHKYDVMLDARWDISENVVGPFTAYCIGWLDELPEEYNCPEWWS